MKADAEVSAASRTDQRWVLILASIAIAACYYEYDAIAPVAHLLRSERGFSQSQIGLLNAVFSLPNIVLALVGGVLIDRFGPARVIIWTSGLCFVGAMLTAAGEPFSVMVSGRLIFGVSEEALFIALLAAIAKAFDARNAAFAMALFFSLARVGSYAADTSAMWARALYDAGWRPPLVLGAAIAGIGFFASIVYFLRFRGRTVSSRSERVVPSQLLRFDRSYWYILALNVLFASAFFPFRSTFALVYFQDAKGLTLQQAGFLNSWVFFAAIFATPAFGWLADRFGHRALMMMVGAALLPSTFLILGATDWSLWISTVLMGLSFSVIPAVIWPATAMLVAPNRLGTAYGLINVLQNIGLAACNLMAGWLNDHNAAGPHHPKGYDPMLWFFTAIGLVAFAAITLLWRRESGPFARGLERPHAAR